jgi:hypothetical protein
MRSGVSWEEARRMTSTASPTAPLLYVECDLAEGQTLTEWRRARHADRAPHGRVQRFLHRFRRRPGEG